MRCHVCVFTRRRHPPSASRRTRGFRKRSPATRLRAKLRAPALHATEHGMPRV